MDTAICTLFEGHYHYGVAALANSLYHNGYTGTVYVGYRGNLPDWAKQNGIVITQSGWEIATEVNFNDDLKLLFLLLDTDYSLTNYKPNFMIDLITGPAINVDAIYYFDPDIVVTEPWSCFEDWVKYGVALCEDVNSPIPGSHPRRMGWRKYFKDYGLQLEFKSEIYVNGGFVGLTKKDKEFLQLWKQSQDYMADAIGGLENSIFSNQAYDSTIPVLEGFQIFDKSDQDALNVAVEVFEGDISFIGAEGMGFKYGHNLMLHALGSPKPWKTNFLLHAIKGKQPSIADTAYWKIKQQPIIAHSKLKLIRKNFSIYIAKFVCRFYSV